MRDFTTGVNPFGALERISCGWNAYDDSVWRGRVFDPGCDESGCQRAIRAIVTIEVIDAQNFRLRSEESAHHRWIKMASTTLAYDGAGFVEWHGPLLGTANGKSVEHIADGHDAANQRDVATFESARVAGAIPFLVMGESHDFG